MSRSSCVRVSAQLDRLFTADAQLPLTTGSDLNPGTEVTKLFFVPNSAEHEFLNAHKYKNIKKFSFFRAKISQ